MASYIFLMEFGNNTQLTESDEGRLKIISEIGAAVTLISCVLNLCLLCLLSIKNDGLFITGNMCGLLMAAQISFIGAENTGYPHPSMCKIATCLIHYFFLCIQFASLAYALHLWSKFGPVCVGRCGNKPQYLVLIWLLPLVIVLLTLTISGHRFANTERCWLPEVENIRLAFLLPLGLILTVNSFIYVAIVRYTVTMEKSRNVDSKTRFRNVCKMGVSLIPMLGLQWLLGFSVTFNAARLFQYLYVIFVSTQGLLVLVFHVLTNGEVQRALCGKLGGAGEDGTEPNTGNSSVDMPKEKSKSE